MLENLNSCPDVPEVIKKIINGLAIQDTETLHYLLSVVMRGGCTIPFSAFENISGEGILTCGINTQDRTLNVIFIPGSKEEIMEKMKAMMGGKQVEVVDPYAGNGMIN